jgi:SAM-dependent methyltransferase
MRLVTLIACAFALALPAGGSGRARQDGSGPPAPAEVRAPFITTPPLIVEEMLKVAKVTKEDVVYDLGCGDGRIVIAAARMYGARGVCIDIDPERIREARANAERAGVAARIEFITQDLFESDLRGATVVTLFLMRSLNLRLRPKLLRELGPGARVVSQAFDMGDWRPAKKVEVDGGGTWGTVYYWVIPGGGRRSARPRTP